jgi:hypothetical protein
MPAVEAASAMIATTEDFFMNGSSLETAAGALQHGTPHRELWPNDRNGLPSPA